MKPLVNKYYNIRVEDGVWDTLFSYLNKLLNVKDMNFSMRT